MELHDRTRYTDKLLEYVTKGLIIALTGQRRVGKSCIIKLVINRLKNNPKNNIIYINFSNTFVVNWHKVVVKHIKP